MTAHQLHPGQWIAENNLIRPDNPYITLDSNGYKNIDWGDTFESFANQHTYATDLPNGIYQAKQLGEVVWQKGLPEGWINALQSETKYHSKFEEWSKELNYNGLPTRAFLTTKPMSKERTPTIQKGDTVEITGNLSKDLLALPVPRLGEVTNVNGAYVMVQPNGLSYPCEFLENEVTFYSRPEELTPAPLSEQKQDGETIEKDAAQDEAYNLIMSKYKDRPTGYKVGFEIGFLECAQWQSQHTAKELAESQARVKELEAALLNLWVCTPDTDETLEKKGLADALCVAQSLTRHLIK
jgi:hypothetical protein